MQCRRTLLGIVATCAADIAVAKNAYAGDGAGFLYDETELLTPPTERYLDGLLKGLEAETQLKVRVVCPPPGLQEDRERWREYLRPLSRAWGLDQSSLVIVVELPKQKRAGSAVGTKQLGLIGITLGSKLQQRFQYTLTKDYVLRTASLFGDTMYMEEKGTDYAIRAATENVVAALYILVERQKTGLPRLVRGLREPVEAEEVAKVLERHLSF